MTLEAVQKGHENLVALSTDPGCVMGHHSFTERFRASYWILCFLLSPTFIFTSPGDRGGTCNVDQG